ncbi:iron-containing redox enzyme family protein [Belnapia sp. F-4-1]|uniref:iron-containing redox enzyme family protein n=1 Tax=Belnapia sp. F-4-1 TaxID=1545443 RepID=UPI0005B9243C|nr:iron-containing redox enzyme family protein [Belnapia sp. F-4-1]
MLPRDTEAGMERINAVVKEAQERFAVLLRSYLEHHGTTVDQYVRYLSFQYHLTRGVQRYFLAVAAHPDLAKRRKLRRFLTDFANEEELHYLVAASDLDALGLNPMPMPFDVELWHAYFTSIIAERPFVRLGAATVLENISDGPAKPWVVKALQGPFLRRENTKFLVLHQHETLPHGTQIMDAIAEAGLERRHFDDLVEGARKGAVLYLRMAEWAVRPDSLAALLDQQEGELSEEEKQRIRSFDMRELTAAA